jgi:hypothetical protein
MGNPRFIVNPTCETGYYDKGNEICISLYRAPVMSEDGKTELSPAKNYHKCFPGGAQVSGEGLAEDIKNDLKEAGWDASIVPPAGHDVDHPEMTDPKTGKPVPRYAPSKTHNAQIAIIEVKNADLCDYYFTEVDFTGRLDPGGAGRVDPQPSGGGWQPPLPPGVKWGKPEKPGGEVPKGRPKGPTDKEKAGIYLPGHIVAGDTPADSSIETPQQVVSVLRILSLADNPAASVTLDVILNESDGPRLVSLTRSLRRHSSPVLLIGAFHQGLLEHGLWARSQGSTLLFRSRTGALSPFFQVRWEIAPGRNGMYIILGDLSDRQAATMLAHLPLRDIRATRPTLTDTPAVFPDLCTTCGARLLPPSSHDTLLDYLIATPPHSVSVLRPPQAGKSQPRVRTEPTPAILRKEPPNAE